MHERISNVIDAIGEAYSIVFDSVNDLADHCAEDESFSEINRIGRKDFEYAFEYLQEPNLSEFTDRVEEIYEIKILQQSKA
jgi:predicted house-cleaning noncanonical NTP pyrophosphatase (MazG superfamily)